MSAKRIFSNFIKLPVQIKKKITKKKINPLKTVKKPSFHDSMKLSFCQIFRNVRLVILVYLCQAKFKLFKAFCISPCLDPAMQTVFAFFNVLKRVKMPQVPARNFLFISNGFTSKRLYALGPLYFRIQMSNDLPNSKKTTKVAWLQKISLKLILELFKAMS